MRFSNILLDNLLIFGWWVRDVNSDRDESKSKDDIDIQYELKLNEMSQYNPMDILYYIVYLILERSDNQDLLEKELSVWFLKYVSLIEQNQSILDHLNVRKNKIFYSKSWVQS